MLREIQNGVAMVEDSTAVPQEKLNRITMRASKPSSTYMSQRIEIRDSDRKLYTSVHQHY